MRTDAEAALARAWIGVQDDLDVGERLDEVRVAADRLQVEGHLLGELVTLGLALLDARDPELHRHVREAYLDRVHTLLPIALGPFASLFTHPKAFAMRWSLCFVEAARLPLAKAHVYAGLLGRGELDAAGMLALFLDQPATACLRSLTLDLGGARLDSVLAILADSDIPIETLVVRGHALPNPRDPAPARAAALPYLHTLVLQQDALPLPEADPGLPWTGDARSIRALGRAATSEDPHIRAPAFERIYRLGRNSGRYLEAIRASDPRIVPYSDKRRLSRGEVLTYAEAAASLERQRVRFEADGVHPRWALRARWRDLVPRNKVWFELREIEDVLVAHDRLLDSPTLEPLAIDALADAPAWIELRAQAEQIRQYALEAR